MAGREVVETGIHSTRVYQAIGFANYPLSKNGYCIKYLFLLQLGYGFMVNAPLVKNTFNGANLQGKYNKWVTNATEAGSSLCGRADDPVIMPYRDAHPHESGC
jgi:hypothetical protein